MTTKTLALADAHRAAWGRYYDLNRAWQLMQRAGSLLDFRLWLRRDRARRRLRRAGLELKEALRSEP